MSESESKERLLAAAKALFLERGYAATTVDAICEKAGLTKGSFYHFYKSKETLGLAVLDWCSVSRFAVEIVVIWAVGTSLYIVGLSRCAAGFFVRFS